MTKEEIMAYIKKVVKDNCLSHPSRVLGDRLKRDLDNLIYIVDNEGKQND